MPFNGIWVPRPIGTSDLGDPRCGRVAETSAQKTPNYLESVT